MKEKWKDVKGFEGIYQISNLGNVRNIKTSKFLKPSPNKSGYLRVNLSRKDKIKACYVHRLVATAFLEKVTSKEEVNHKDVVKSNNCVKNLEWVNRKENVQHSHSLGINEKNQVKGSRVGISILTESDVIFIKKNQYKYKKNELSKMFNTSESNIYAILSGRSWKHI